MNPKIILAAVSFSLALAALQPVLAGPRIGATNKQAEIERPAGIAPIRGDLHVFLKAF
jgi:hypothetical protein